MINSLLAQHMRSMKKYFTVYISREKFSIFAILLFLLTFSVEHVFAQDVVGDTIFYDDFGAPPTNLANPTDNAGVRKTWAYMPTGYNTFVFAHPDAPNITNGYVSDSKHINDNFYAVVGPRYIYSSAGLNYGPGQQNGSNWYNEGWQGGGPLEKSLVVVGDATPGHDGNGGALVVNAGTTRAGLYVRVANLKAGKYYKLSYKLFVQAPLVMIEHFITQVNVNTDAAIYPGKQNGNLGKREWGLQEFWFYMPEEACQDGDFNIGIRNVNRDNNGNDFALDDILFEEYDDLPEGVIIPESARIKCDKDLKEPIAVNDVKEGVLKEPVSVSILDNDKTADNKQATRDNVTVELIPPSGGLPNKWDLNEIRVPGQGTWKYDQSTAILTFKPEDGFTGNPTPMGYRITDKNEPKTTSNMATVTILYKGNPIANDDKGEANENIPILSNDKKINGEEPKPGDEGIDEGITVTLIHPFDPQGNENPHELIVEGEGKWGYNPETGNLLFAPEPTFEGTPTPITYTITETVGDQDKRTSNKATVTIGAVEPQRKNYWHGTIDNVWDKEGNWTANKIPAPGEDIEFATEANNPTQEGVGNSGPAKNDLYLGADRVIGDLINDSDKDLWITTDDQLTIHGEVKDNNPDKGTIIVKASPTEPSGTLLFKNPDLNKGVGAIVEFYNQAYDCAECGFYTRSWQYFGIPVQEEDVFPSNEVYGNETVNQWVEPFNGNKWQPAPYAPDTKFVGFKGYQITNDVTTEPSGVYPFAGVLNVGDASVSLTRTNGVNYAGTNLVGNSFTAAIPISEEAMTFPTGVEETVYLFNTGTRDQWRKLNGSAINQKGYKRGQYLAVPINLGGQEDFPDRIPSMHAFMLRATQGMGGSLGIKYDKLVKNTKVALGDGETEIVTRSAGVETNKSLNVASGGSGSSGNSVSQQLPSLVMDVIGEESADRVWIFAKEGTSYGFDNGWDGRKMLESGIAQLYVSDENHQDKFQVATVPSVDNLSVGFEAEADGKYTLEFALSDHWKSGVIYLFDQLTGERVQVKNGGSYSFQAKKGDNGTRFIMSYSGEDISLLDEASKIVVSSTENGKIMIQNGSSRECTVFVSGLRNGFFRQIEVAAGKEVAIEGVTSETYMVRLQNAVVHDVRRVVVK